MDNVDNTAVIDLAKTLAEKGGLENMIAEVVKATNNATGFSTRQSLSKEVADLTIRQTPFFDMVARDPNVINSIHQWDAITAISNQASFALPIDSVGNDADPTITRLSENVRYYACTTRVGQFTHAISRPELPAQQIVDEKAIQAIRYDIEGDLFTGGAAADNIRGIDNIIDSFSPADHVDTNANAALTSTTKIDDLSSNMAEKGTPPTHYWFNAKDKTQFRNIFLNNTRYNNPFTAQMKLGYSFESYISSLTSVDVMWDFFIPKKAPTSTGYLVNMNWVKLGEPMVNGSRGIAMQDLAKTGPQTTKLINYYGLLVYQNVNAFGKITNIGA